MGLAEIGKIGNEL